MMFPQEPLYALRTKYFLNINKNDNIYCIAVVKLEELGYTSICGLGPVSARYCFYDHIAGAYLQSGHAGEEFRHELQA
jgi:hypothetical protein